jgi:tRNA dimethylallyltransferase
MNKAKVICLMGPTSSGKTSLSLELVKRFPFEIVSVDSAMVYRGMDIGTAKPSPSILQQIPHHLIDIRDPSHAYSAGEFRRDCMQCIADILARGNIPLLVGGTMLYFSVLQHGIAELPTKNERIRQHLQHRAEQQGLHTLHQELMQVDEAAGQRINPHDTQRIQRALEVYLATGKTLTAWQQAANETNPYHFHFIGLVPSDRLQLHQRIAQRFQEMIQQGFVAEVELMYKANLSADLPALRSVGYRQIWSYLSGEITYTEACEKAIAATRQLAKRQLTWLRSWQDLTVIDADTNDAIEKVIGYLP